MQEPIQKNNWKKKRYSWAQVEECLPRKHKATSLNHSTTKKPTNILITWLEIQVFLVLYW
jgi:hypothetical protein